MTTTDVQNVSAIVPVVEGDYFEALAYQASGQPPRALASTGTWFAIEAVE